MGSSEGKDSQTHARKEEMEEGCRQEGWSGQRVSKEFSKVNKVESFFLRDQKSGSEVRKSKFLTLLYYHFII